MTENKMDESVEAELQDLYTSPEPDSAFIHLLRVRVLEQARRKQRFSWSRQLWSRFANAGYFTFKLISVALLLVLVWLSANLLARQPSISLQNENSNLEAVATLPPVATAQLSTATPEFVYELPELAPSVCDSIITPEPVGQSEQMPDRLLGGGTVKSGDNQISLYLFCDDTNQSSNSRGFSEIRGLGIYEATSSESTGLGKARAYTKPLNLGAYLPNVSFTEIPVRYIYRIASDALLYSPITTTNQLQGAMLSFRLIRREDGLVVEDIQIESLSHEQLPPNTEPVTIARSVPTLDPASLHPLLGELMALQEVQKSWLYDRPGWIFFSEQRKVAGMANDPTYVTWYEVDIRGNLLRYANQETMPWGKNPPTMKTRHTVWNSSSQNMDKNFSYGPYAFDLGIYTDAVMAIKQGGTISRQEMLEGIEFTITTETREIKALFDPQTGSPIKSEYYDVTPSGKKNRTSTRSGIVLERVDEPPPDVMNLFE